MFIFLLNKIKASPLRQCVGTFNANKKRIM
nr:MAG TPA: hypothetical protein [Caudoviricetes sp.]